MTETLSDTEQSDVYKVPVHSGATTAEKPKGTQVDITAAQAAIEADSRQRAEAAGREIQAALQRHRCQLVATPQLTQDGRIVAVSQVVAQ